MSKLDALLERMAALVGISPDYSDAFGKTVETSADTRKALLAALGLDVTSGQGAQDEPRATGAAEDRPAACGVTVEAETPRQIKFRSAARSRRTWVLTEERRNRSRRPACAKAQPRSRYSLPCRWAITGSG